MLPFGKGDIVTEKETRGSSLFPYLLFPGLVVSPFISGYLRNHHVGSSPLRALIVGLIAAVVTLIAVRIAYSSGVRSVGSKRLRFALIAIAIVTALVSIGSDWITVRWG